jgi:hypothetical protein
VSGAALTPTAALAWLASLSVDLRATAVIGADGACLAGDEALARRAAALLAAAASGTAGAARTADAPGSVEVRDGDVLAVRSDRHGVAAALGPRALERLARADLRAALEALDGR